MRRVLIERTRFAVVLVLLGAALVLVLGQQNAPWIGDALWGQETVGAAQILLLAVIGGLGAIDGREDGFGLLRIFASRRDRIRHVLLRGLTAAVFILVIYGAAHLAVWLLSTRASLNFENGTFWPLVTQWSTAIAAYVVSYAVTSDLRSWGSVVAATAMWPVLLLADQTGTLPSGFAEFGGGGTMLGFHLSWAHFACRTLWLIAIATLAFVWTTIRRGRAGGFALGSIATGLGVLGVFAFGASGYQYRQLPNVACVGAQPRLCGPHVLAARVQEAGPVIGAAAKELRTLGVAPPAEMVAWTPSTPATANEVSVYDPGRIRAPIVGRELIAGVVAPRSCGLWTGDSPPPTRWFTAERLVSDVVANRLAGQPPSALEKSLLQRVGAARARSIVRAAASGLSECNVVAIPEEVSQLESLGAK